MNRRQNNLQTRSIYPYPYSHPYPYPYSYHGYYPYFDHHDDYYDYDNYYDHNYDYYDYDYDYYSDHDYYYDRTQNNYHNNNNNDNNDNNDKNIRLPLQRSLQQRSQIPPQRSQISQSPISRRMIKTPPKIPRRPRSLPRFM